VFPPRLFEQPNSVFVYGPSRPVVNMTVFAFASVTNPEFHWVELGAVTGGRDRLDPVQLGWIPPDRLWIVGEPDAFRRPTTSGMDRLSDMIHSDEPPDSLDQLAEFLKLPDRSQEVFTFRSSGGRPGVVAVTDVHHLQGELSARRISSVLSVHLNAGVSVIVGNGTTSGTLRDLFGFVFRVLGPEDAPSEWKDHRLVCEKGITSGPLGGLRPMSYEAIPLLREVFQRAGSTA